MNFDSYSKCMLCPRKCGIDRRTKRGFCGMTAELTAARAALHFWEEPCISGTSGSGTVFFSGCQLKCVFCQNRSISAGGTGKVIDTERLCDIFIELKQKGANNINLVSGTQFLPHITAALDMAKKKGLDIPIVYNCGGYESADTIRMLSGYIDIYLPDFKYMYGETAKGLSNAVDYPQRAAEAVEEMVRQTGEAEFFNNGIMKKGVIIRHLVIPGHIDESKKIIRYLFEKYGNKVWLSIMNQYTPMPGMEGELCRKLTDKDYTEVVDFAIDIGVENGFIQEGETAKESFIPSFSECEGI